MTLIGRQGHFSYFCGIIFRFLIESPGDLMKHDIADDFEGHFRYNTISLYVFEIQHMMYDVNYNGRTLSHLITSLFIQTQYMHSTCTCR